MYAAEQSLPLPFFEGLSPPPPIAQLIIPLAGDLPEHSSPQGNLLLPSTIFEYDLGGEEDLFKDPEPIIEEELLATTDPLSAAMNIMSDENDVINNRIYTADIQTIQNDHLFSNVFYEYTKDLLQQYAINESVHEPTAIQISAISTEEAPTLENGRVDAEVSLHKSGSVGCLNCTEWFNGGEKPNSHEFQDFNFECAYGMRRAYSEGDIQKLDNATTSLASTSAHRSSLEKLVTMGNFKSEERRQKLSRYMKKKTKRNFGRKIKYACRKALADSQPRVRGRFARFQELDISKQQK